MRQHGVHHPNQDGFVTVMSSFNVAISERQDNVSFWNPRTLKKLGRQK
jgi:hypothetical protein